jgi:hypothetical protein
MPEHRQKLLEEAFFKLYLLLRLLVFAATVALPPATYIDF